MKFTEGAFRDWGYEVAKAEFRDSDRHRGRSDGRRESKEGKILINDRIADSVFQQILTRTADYDVFATPNLNGDYLSDACAAQVGGLGMAPGANMSDDIALLRGDARHGAEVRRQGRHQPGSVILSGVMMLQYLGWNEAADLVTQGPREDHRAEEGDLRPGAPDGRRDRAQDVAVRRRHHREHVGTCGRPRLRSAAVDRSAGARRVEESRSVMNRKVTVVGGAGNVGATAARVIAEQGTRRRRHHRHRQGQGRRASRSTSLRPARSIGSDSRGRRRRRLRDERRTRTSSSSPRACRASRA